MIPYYSPHLNFWDLFKALFTKNAENKTTQYFRNYTGKKYILPTASCRMALLLSYQAIDRLGDVIVSPLTCKSAVDPILWSGSQPVFTEVTIDGLEMEISSIQDLIDDETIAIQIINHGGTLVNIDSILNEIKGKDIFVIEDCAQSFGSTINQQTPLFQSDIVCFSLIKNVYGIGGGILATNSQAVYEKAKYLQSELALFPISKVMYRIFYGLLETKQNLKFISYALNSLIKIRRSKVELDNGENTSKKHLVRPHSAFFRLFASRIDKMQKLQRQRKQNGSLLFQKLLDNDLAFNYTDRNLFEMSFTKLFIYHPKIDSRIVINDLNKSNIKAKHLEQREDGRVQTRFDKLPDFRHSFRLNDYDNYKMIHDSLVSLPLTENMTECQMNEVVNTLKNVMNENNMV